ncbi:hypothetical protein EDB86DRAFT_621847 [Lactarius hatsudake]|nr:hypothetical protein EDB86DRAFT_621847 [Lactarius hatsudake]
MYAAPPSPPFAAPKPCKFFPKGRCNKGDDCPFGHTVSNSNSYMLNSVTPFDGPVHRRRIKQSSTNKHPPATYQTRGGPSAPPFERDDDLSYAMRLQNEFDNEDRALSAERIRLSQTAQQVFECGICMEEMPEDSVARLDPCEHAFCRECMRGYVSTRLEEHRFPVLCPTCAASKGKGRGVAGEVSQTLAQGLGLTDEQFDIWVELEMTSFSVLLHCRKCQRSMFVARDEHEEAEIIECPLPDCDYAWCMQCQKTIDFSGPDHSCDGDGTSELDDLVKQEGWKYCPSCKTPIQKVSGCNHMACMTPACNTHFCYHCGDLIVKSALREEINEAMSSHFRSKCSLFEVDDDDDE